MNPIYMCPVGEIKDNSAGNYGGGIFLYGVTEEENVEISGGTIQGNKAWQGGGVALSSGAHATMSGGKVVQNHSSQKAPPQKDNKKPILRISEEGSVEIRRPFFLRISEEGADSRLAVRAPAI